MESGSIRCSGRSLLFHRLASLTIPPAHLRELVRHQVRAQGPALLGSHATKDTNKVKKRNIPAGGTRDRRAEKSGHALVRGLLCRCVFLLFPSGPFACFSNAFKPDGILLPPLGSRLSHARAALSVSPLITSPAASTCLQGPRSPRCFLNHGHEQRSSSPSTT